MRLAVNIQKRTIQQYIGSIISDPNALLARLDNGAFNFMVAATEYARDAFKESFSNGGFYKQSKWTLPTTPNKTGRTMVETGDLMDLKLKTQTLRKKKYGRVYTDEKRGARTKKKKIGYAAVHNDPLSSYTVNQYSSRAPIQRQFMGHNAALYREISNRYEDLIFEKLRYL